MHPAHTYQPNLPKLPRPTYGMPQIIAHGGEFSARPTQYSMQSFELPSHPSPRPRSGGLGNTDGPMGDILRTVSHGEPFGGGFPGSATGLSNMENSYDTDMSGGQASSGLTPENSSSNTSYSPSSQDMADIGSGLPKPTGHEPANSTARTSKAFNFTNTNGNFGSLMPNQPQQINGEFDLSSSTWNFDANVASPSNFTTGLTPAADGEWSQILENMNWDSTMLDTNAT